RSADEGSEPALDSFGSQPPNGRQFRSKHRRYRLDGAELSAAGCNRRIAKDCYPFNARRNLAKKFEPFPAHAVFERSKSGGVGPWTRKALDESAADWVGVDGEHDRDRPGGLLQGTDRRAHGQTDVRCQRD